MSSTYHEYDPATLARLQKILRSMLADFDALCKKHGLTYFGYAGTAIGALRHGDIIPWDDDVDVAFLREDYEKFLRVAETEYGDKYYILNARTNPRYPSPNTRWCLRGTAYRESSMNGLKDVPLGIFLDVYAFDAIPDDERAARRQWRHAWFWGKLMILRHLRSPMIFASGPRAWLLEAACRVGHVLLRVFTRPSLYPKMVERWSRKYEGKPGCSRAAWMFSTGLYKSIVRAEAVRRPRTVPFGDATIDLNADAEENLRGLYGDFMRIPPPEKRYNHPPEVLDFGPFGDVPAEKPYKVGITVGVFDLFHVGHLNLLERCKARCERLVVGVCGDDYVTQVKKKTPAQPEECRRRILSALRCVDEVVPVSIGETEDKLLLLANHPFDVLFSGDDWKDTPRYRKTEEQFARLGAKIEYFPYTPGVSTTALKRIAGAASSET